MPEKNDAVIASFFYVVIGYTVWVVPYKSPSEIKGPIERRRR